VGGNLALHLQRQGYPIGALIEPRREALTILAQQIQCPLLTSDLAQLPPTIDVILIATPDQAIATVGRKLVQLNYPFKNKYVFHFSGALPASHLGFLEEYAARIASCHPIQSFIAIENGLTNLTGIYFGLEGNPAAVRLAKSLVRDLGGIPLEIPSEQKSLYHAACVSASNFLVALVLMAANILSKVGFGQSQSVECLLPLLETTLSNLKSSGVQDALTGPVRRGDWQTVKSHLQSLADQSPEFYPVYQNFTQILVHFCVQRGIMTPEIAQQFEITFQEALGTVAKEKTDTGSACKLD
jgi:predicted short-subunit dehydrogenase-like oxidoreductase (DUF2520 family)